MEWDLSDPKQARDFLKNVQFGDRKNPGFIKYLKTVEGTEISIDDASDEQVFQVVNMIANAMSESEKGKRNKLKDSMKVFKND